jgi:DNA-binding NtrC family response regulator
MKRQVLVVDDEPSVLITYKLILEQQGYVVSAAPTSKEALDLIHKIDFDLVLTDYSLEQMHTGFEVIEAARKKRSTVPCVLLTGYATLETAGMAEQSNIGILFKPIDISQFLETVANLLRKQHEPNDKETQQQNKGSKTERKRAV